MPPTVILMRTAQAFHYLPDIDYHHKRMKWPDTELTPAGERMCVGGARDLAEQQSSISLVVASPMTRALQTAILVFGRALELPSCADAVIALPTVKETFNYPFNTGSSTDKLKKLCAEKNWPVDLTMVEDGWTDMSLQSPYFQASAALRMRARKTRRWLKGKLDELVRAGKENATIALVSHGNFLHWLTDDWEKADDLRHTGWYYCEYREYFFEKSAPASWHDEYRFQPHYPDSRNGVAVLVETSHSLSRRGIWWQGASDWWRRPTKEEQEILYYRTLRDWPRRGLPDVYALNAVLMYFC
jgi:broad specificity phosphatase PhoE